MKKLATFILVILPFAGMSQTGPGGVGSVSGGSSLQMWYESQDVNGDNLFNNNPANGSTLTTWTDKSGNGRNMTAPSGNEPQYNTALSFKTVNFSSNGVIQYMNVGSGPGALRPGTMYFFYHITDIVGDGAFCFFDDGTGSGSTSVRVAQWNNTDELGFTRYSVSDYTSGTATNYGAFNISSWRRPGGASNNVVITQNAAASTVNISSSSDGLPTARFGKNSGSDGANANMGEVLVYNTDLNLAERDIVENYLSAKYSGTGTAVSIPDDIYTMDNNANGNYDYDVAGIGQASDGTNHTSSKGTGIVQFSSPSGLGNNEFMFWGHDNGVMQSMNHIDVPLGISARFGRVWRISERGNVGNVDIAFDLTGFGPVTASDLRLLIDVNNDGLFSNETAISGATSLGGNVYQFSAVASVANNLRFSLATINVSQTPLPLGLLSFTATATDNHEVLLEWATASEENSSYFEVERSQDAIAWETVAHVNAAGNSVTEKQYSAKDMMPLNGITYYRVKEVSLQGINEYSVTRSINPQTHLQPGVIIYPNPTNGSVIVQADDEELSTVRVFDLSGKAMDVPVTDNGNGSVIVNLSGLANGKYILKTTNTTHVVEKQ